MKTIKKIVYLLFLVPFVLCFGDSFSPNRANVWIDNGGLSNRTFSVDNWSSVARIKDSEIVVNSERVAVSKNLQSLSVLVNNVARSYPAYHHKLGLPYLSLIGLDPANSPLGVEIDNPILSISPNGGEFNSSIEVTLTLYARKGWRGKVDYQIDDRAIESVPLSVTEGNNRISLYLVANGTHTIKYRLKKEKNFSIATFTIVNSVDDMKKQDSDGDGIPDIIEDELGMNPFDKNLKDSDGNGWSDFDERLRNNNLTDSDGDGWSDFDEEKLRGTDKNDAWSKPTAKRLYGVEYKLHSSAFDGETKRASLKRLSFVDTSSLTLYDSDKRIDFDTTIYYNKAVSRLLNSELEDVLSGGNIPTVRLPADVPLIERASDGLWVVKGFIASTTDVTLQEYYREFNRTEVTEPFNADVFIAGYINYLKEHLVVNRSSIVVNEESSSRVALLESAFMSRVDSQSTHILGHPDFSMLKGNSPREVNQLYLDLITIMDEKSPTFLPKLTSLFEEEDNNSTENRLANFMQSDEKVSKKDRYRVSLMTILSYATAVANPTLFDFNLDTDKDGILNQDEVFPLDYTNPLKADSDEDGQIDSEDVCPNSSDDGCLNDDISFVDSDKDGVNDVLDNCPFHKNLSQKDTNGNGIGDICEKVGVVLTTPRTNIKLFQGETFTFVAEKTTFSNINFIWKVANKKVDEPTMQLEYTFSTVGEREVCIVADHRESIKSCVGVTILKRDLTSSLNLYSRDVLEGDSGKKSALVEVVLSKALPIKKSYPYVITAKTATKNSDYLGHKGKIVFNAGEIRKYLKIPIIGDTIEEGDETFEVKVGSEKSVIVTIIDDDVSPTLHSLNPNIVVTEGTGANHTVSFDFELDRLPKSRATLEYIYAVPIPSTGKLIAIGDVSGNGELTFEVGQKRASMEVTILADNIDEADDNVHICLRNPQNVKLLGEELCVTLSVIDDDEEPTVWFDPTTISKSESTGRVYGVVKLSRLSTRDAIASISVASESSATSTDYTFTPVTLSFFDEEQHKYVKERVVELNITNDTEVEELEKVILEIDSTERCLALENKKQFIINILDDDRPKPLLSMKLLDSNRDELTNWSVLEGDVDKNITIQFNLSRMLLDNEEASFTYEKLLSPAPINVPGEVLYPEYHSMIRELVNGTIEFTKGKESRELNVTVIGDSINESQKAFGIRLSNATNINLYSSSEDIIDEYPDRRDVMITIVDNDPMPILSFEKSEYNTTEGKELNIKLMLSEKSYQTVEINLTVDDMSTAEDSETVEYDDYNISTKNLVILATNPEAIVENLTAIVDVNISKNLVGENNETIILDINSSKKATINQEANSTTINIEEERVISPSLAHILFNFRDKEHGDELWRSNGQVRGATLLQDIVLGEEGSSPSNFTRVSESELYFTAYDAEYHKILFKSDGQTESSVVKILESNQTIESLVNVEGKLYFILIETDDMNGETVVALWRSDGLHTEKVKDLKKVEYMEAKLEMVYSDGKLAILLGSQLLKYNLLEEDESRALEVVKGVPLDAQLSQLTTLDGIFYFVVNYSEIWQSNSQETKKSTFIKEKDVNVNAMVSTGEILYYAITTSSGEYQLFGVKQGASYFIKKSTYAIYSLKAVGSYVYWVNSATLFSLKGKKVVELKSFENGNRVTLLEDSINSNLFFTRTIYGANGETTLWKSDGTGGGTINLMGKL